MTTSRRRFQFRYATPRSPERETLGPRVAQVAAGLGKPLMPWQQYVVDVALEIDPDDGMLAYSEVDIVVPRQQGKTELILPVATHRCMAFEQAGPQQVLYTTQTADKAREKWRDIHLKRLEASPFRTMFTPRLRLNAEAIMWRNGSMWTPGATTGKTGGTGDTLDLGIIDEAWSRPDHRTELGMRPAMLTRPWRQLWVVSMIPGISRCQPDEWRYLRAKRDAGRARVDTDKRRGVAYFECSAEEGLDPADPATWWSCMPALGHTIGEKAVRDDFDGDMDLVDFCAEYLGWAPKSRRRQWAVIGRTTWDALYDEQSEPADPISLGVDALEDRSSTAISSAGLRLDGDLHIELVDRRPGVSWAEDALVELCTQHDVCQVAIDVNGPAASLIEPLLRRSTKDGRDIPIKRMNLKEVSAGCGRFYDLTGEQRMVAEADGLMVVDADGNPVVERRIRHIGQGEMTRAVASAEKYKFGDQWRWLRSTEVDVTPLYAATLALAAGESVEWEGGNYDIMRTLG